MNFRKLALASAVAAVPTVGFSMEALQDEVLSDVTGQDGIAITITTTAPLVTSIMLEDDNGVTGSTTYGNTAATYAGALFIENASLTVPVTGLQINIDAGGNLANTAAQLQIAVTIPANTTIVTGAIKVLNTDGAFATNFASTTIFSSQTIALATGATFEMELGAEETAFMHFTSANIGTLALGAGSIADANGSTISWAAGSAVTGLNLTGTTVNVQTTGVLIDLGASMNAVGVTLTDLTFGTQPALGDLRITGLDLSGVNVLVAGKN